MRERLKAEIAAALKGQNRPRLSALRLISAALQERELATSVPLADQEIPLLLRKMIRQRRDAYAIYTKAGRAEQAAQEAGEIAVIEEFLPAQLNETEVRVHVAAAIREVGAGSPREIGKVMSLLKARHQGRMDFAKASGIVKEMLA